MMAWYLCDLKGIRTVLPRNLYFCDFSGGGGTPDPLSPLLGPPMYLLFNLLRLNMVIGF